MVNLIGEGMQYWFAELSESLYKSIIAIMTKQNISLNEVIFDLEILNQLGIESWTDIPYEKKIIALKPIAKSKIEIKQRNKKIVNVRADEISSDYYLFPLYNISLNSIHDEGFIKSTRTIVFGYEITGVIQSYNIKTECFNINDFVFCVNENSINNYRNLLESVFYGQKPLKSRPPSFILRSFFAEFMDVIK